MKLKRFKNFINEEFLFDPNILPIDLQKGNYYTIFDKKKNEWRKGFIYDDASTGGVKVKANVHLFEIEDYDDEDLEDRLKILAEHVNTNIVNYDDNEPVNSEDLKKGETYRYKNDFSGEFNDWCKYIGFGKAEIEVPNYWFIPFSDDTIYKANNIMINIPYTELKERVKEDLVSQNRARKKYGLY